jgi:subtilisin family serine protease
VKKVIKITGIIFVLLLLTFSSMPGVQAVSLPPVTGSRVISPQAVEPGSKVASLLKLQVDAKVRCQQVPPTADELGMMETKGMRIENLGMQRIFIHLAQEPTPSQIDELQAMGITPYPDSWIPPVDEYPTGFIVADMPVDKLDELAGKDYVVQLDTAEQLLKPQNDLAAIKINADDVWNSGYDGSGVRIAVLDSGLDTTHPDIPVPVASKDYSNWPLLDDTIANTVSGHGTHVTGSVVGQGTQSAGATHQYKGMAPGADLIFLKIGDDATSDAPLAAMTNAIKAAVDTYDADIITMSYGGWDSYHDGTRETSQAVDYAFSKGAVVFISAGNEASDGEHYSGTVNANSTTGFIQVNVTGSNGANAGLGFNLVWYDGLANSNDLVLEYYRSDQAALADTWASAQEESWKGTEHELSGYGPDAGWYFYLPWGNSTYYLKVTNNSDNNQFFHIYFEGIASSGASVQFQNSDPFYTLSSPADAEKAIAVGAYTTREDWTNYEGDAYTYNETLNAMASFSSRGPRVDSGAPQKPNIVAPGSAIISVRDQDVYTLGNPDYDPRIVDNDGLNLNGSGPADYFVMQGTSMASPIAAGATALLLEAKPELKGHPADVRNLLQSTATSVNANNNIDGYGLLDIQAAIAASASSYEVDWLFMVYLDADNNLESAGIDDLNEMEVAGSTDRVKIVVQMDRAVRDYDDDTSNGNWTGAKRFYVTRDTDAAIINSPVIADLGEVNMGAPATLQSFIEWAIANYPAQHYALVLWNHGSGWRERAATDAIKSICIDDQANDELTMTELRSALTEANATTGKVLDIIGFDACLMQMVEVAYQVMGSASRPLADIAVGSEETEPGDGWDYAATLTALTTDPAMTPAQLATQMVNDYISSYSPSLGITQSAVRLDLVDELATAIDSFAQAMTSATGDWTAISTARSQAQEYYYDYYIDLYHFAQLVNQNTSISQAVRDAASSVMTAVNNAVIAEGHTASVGDSHGLSIYYPETVGDYFSDYETSVLLTTDTQWDEFLSAILSPAEGVTVIQSGDNFYMDNGVIRIAFYGSDGIEWFGGSPGSLSMAEVERMDALLAEKAAQKEAGEKDSKAIQPENLHVYDEDCAIFSPFGASTAAVSFDYCSGYTTEITNSGPVEGVIKESGTGTVDGQPIVWERYTSLKLNQKFVTCRVVIKNQGTSDLSNVEFYEYMDMDLYDIPNDYAMVPLASGDTRVHVETKYASSNFVDNWIYQRDASQDYHFGMLMKTPEDVTDFYVAQYYGESPPYRIVIDGQTITTGDIVTAFSWQTSISAGGEKEFYYGLAAPDDLATLKTVSNQFHAGGVYVSLSAPDKAVQGDRVSISAEVTNYFSEQKAITVTLTLPSGLSLAPDSEPLEQIINVSGGGTATASWVAVVAGDATGTKTISVSAVEPISDLSDDDSASIAVQPINTVSQSQRETGILIDADSDSRSLDIPSTAACAEGSVTLHPSIELVFIDEVEWLIAYPYGCIEQRGSILLGDVNIYHYLTNADRLTDTLDNTLRQDIVGGSLDIVDLQHGDKGWGWYYSYSSTPFFTCYALQALLETRDWANTYSITIPLSDDGHNFNTYVTRGLEWLIANQQTDGHWDGVTPDYIQDTVPLTAYILYTLAEANSLGYAPAGLSSAITNAISWLQSAQNSDGGWGRAANDEASDSFVTGLTIVALRKAGVASSEAYIQSARADLISESNPQPMPGPATRYWQSSLQSIYRWFAHIPETTSFAVVALLMTGSSNTDDEVAEALNWMLANSNTWLYGSTKDGASAVWMFNQLGVMPGTLNIDVNISVNGTALPTQHFEGTSPSSTTINVTSYLNNTGTNAFDFTSTGSGRVTYEISLGYFVPRLALRTNPTLSLTKSITPVIAPGGQGTVTLNFTPSDDVGYVIINDYIPGGFTLDTSSITAGIAYEVSGDRITFALQSVEANDTVTISYSMTAPQAALGQINVRGAECLLMYQPTITGSSAGVTTQVQTVIPGDANGDGTVNALDITKVERIIVGLDSQTTGADANQDGNVNALDITKVERIIVGLD